MPGFRVRPSLLMVDRAKRSAINGIPRLFQPVSEVGRDGAERLKTAQFIGTAEQLGDMDLLTEVDASEEVELLRDEVEAAAARFEAMLDKPFDPQWASRGSKCYGCEFRLADADGHHGFSDCWGEHAHADPHVLSLFSVGTVRAAGGKTLVEWMLSERNSASLFDVPFEFLARKDGSIGSNAERQRRQISHMRSGEPWISPRLRALVDSVTYPLHFIDFEASRLALPYHANMRCYGQVAFQWSCHTIAAPGAVPVHSEWLNTVDVWPNR